MLTRLLTLADKSSVLDLLVNVVAEIFDGQETD